jgi:alkylation response protein AidB-like acyl-CoA dehydrogenase
VAAVQVLPDVVAEQLARSIAEALASGAESPEAAEKSWAALVDLGVPAFGVPVEADGMDLGQSAAVLVAEQLGRITAGWPYLDGALAADLLAGRRVRDGDDDRHEHGGDGDRDRDRDDRDRDRDHGDDGDDGERDDQLRRIAAGALRPYGAGLTGAYGRRVPAGRPDGDGWLLAADLLPPRPERADALLVRFATPAGELVALAPLGPAGADVRVSPAAVLARGALPAATLERAWLRQAAHLVGVAAAAIDLAIGRAGERRQFGRPLAAYQAVSFPLAALSARVDAARLLAEHTAWLQDTGASPRCAAAGALGTAAELALDAVRQAVHTHGAAGLVRDSPIDRLHRYAWTEAIRWGPPQLLWQQAGAARRERPAGTPAGESEEGCHG